MVKGNGNRREKKISSSRISQEEFEELHDTACMMQDDLDEILPDNLSDEVRLGVAIRLVNAGYGIYAVYFDHLEKHALRVDKIVTEKLGGYQTMWGLGMFPDRMVWCNWFDVSMWFFCFQWHAEHVRNKMIKRTMKPLLNPEKRKKTRDRGSIRSDGRRHPRKGSVAIHMQEEGGVR